MHPLVFRLTAELSWALQAQPDPWTPPGTPRTPGRALGQPGTAGWPGQSWPSRSRGFENMEEEIDFYFPWNPLSAFDNRGHKAVYTSRGTNR